MKNESSTLRFDLWDTKSDSMKKGDNLRDVTPIMNKIFIDERGFTHYIFAKTMFDNPKFIIPDDDFELFQKFLDGGSREYPSDGHLPTDIAAAEAKKILEKMSECANDDNHKYCQIAREELKKNRLLDMVRGTIKLHIKDFTTRDWRRKRFTDDIDFWVFNKPLLEYALKENGWRYNKNTKEFEKVINWLNYETQQLESTLLIASNDVDQILDFGGGSFLDGPTLKDIFKKKLQRGHDVDLSDLINVAIVNNSADDYSNEDWVKAWKAFEEATNTRNTRSTSNIISLCRFSFGIADYIDRVSKAISKYQKTILEDSKYPNNEIVRICAISSHHLLCDVELNPIKTRTRIFNNLTKQKIRKRQYARNIRDFAERVLNLLNLKYINAKVCFEIEK